MTAFRVPLVDTALMMGPRSTAASRNEDTPLRLSLKKTAHTSAAAPRSRAHTIVTLTLRRMDLHHHPKKLLR
jgi:hypothetical protein